MTSISISALALSILLFVTLSYSTPLVTPLAPMQSVYYNSNTGSYSLTQNAFNTRAAGIAVNTNGMQFVGWDVVYAEADPQMLSSTPRVAYHAVGYAEGITTQQRIYQQYLNTIDPIYVNLTEATLDYIASQIDYMNRQVSDSPFDQYWQQVGLILSQINGIYEGYNVNPPNSTLTFTQIYLLSFDFELDDVRNFLEANFTLLRHRRQRASYGSAIVKVTPDDLFMGHTTWSGYSTMLRQYKIYNFSTMTTNLAVSMSSYPGTVFSGDDWYMISSGLTVQKTSLSDTNISNSAFITYDSVPTFIRTMVANYMATTGSSWAATFCQGNSGTYNNQYMVVNMNLFTPGAMLPANTLWVLEQMPSLCRTGDQTSILQEDTYWASFDIPFYLSVYTNSGFHKLEDEFGTFFSYEDSARPMMFKRANASGSLGDLSGIQSTIRYNNYQNDQLSVIPNCTACNPRISASLAIAMRGDLNQANGEYGPLSAELGQVSWGAIDAKIVSWKSFKSMDGWIISGPTYVQQPAFRWSTSPFAAHPHSGIPDLMQFPWTKVSDVWVSSNAAPDAALPAGQAVKFNAVVENYNRTIFTMKIETFLQSTILILSETKVPLTTTAPSFFDPAPLDQTRVVFQFVGTNAYEASLALVSLTPAERKSFFDIDSITEETVPNPAPKPSSKLWIIAVVLGVVLLAVIAFCAVKKRRHAADDGEYISLEEQTAKNHDV